MMRRTFESVSLRQMMDFSVEHVAPRLGLQRTLHHVPNHATHHADARLTEAAPCECCKFAQRCAIEHQACAAFSMYLANEPAVRWRLAPRAPTPARYTALLG